MSIVLAWSESVHGLDKEEFESTYFGYKPQNMSMLVTIYWDDSTTMMALRIFQVIGIGPRAVCR